MKPLIVAPAGMWTRSSGETIEIASMNLHHLRASRIKVESRLAKVRVTHGYAVKSVQHNATPAATKALGEIEQLIASLSAKRDELTTAIDAVLAAPRPDAS